MNYIYFQVIPLRNYFLWGIFFCPSKDIALQGKKVFFFHLPIPPKLRETS
jgi:hypothetical protein